MTPSAASIPALHAAYCRLTGQQIGLNMARENTWFEWLRWRRERPFTVADLAAVIKHLQTGIKKGDRNPGSLKFSNLIGNPDYFEEDLGLALATARPKPPAMQTVRTLTADGQHTERVLPADGTKATARPVAEVIAAMRAAVENRP
jgi:hypothetical protein